MARGFFHAEEKIAGGERLQSGVALNLLAQGLQDFALGAHVQRMAPVC
ncbi:MAG: hypothetical protein IPL70_07260 [Uliginosibacterium sp.]|nr:hypothetical protein [Uliginosibacterium sp.]